MDSTHGTYDGSSPASPDEVSIKLTKSSERPLTDKSNSKGGNSKVDLNHDECNALFDRFTEEDMVKVTARVKPIPRSPEKSNSYGFDPCLSPQIRDGNAPRRGSATPSVSASPAKRAFTDTRHGLQRDSATDDTYIEYDSRKKHKLHVGRLEQLRENSTFENQKHRQDQSDILCKLKDEGIIRRTSNCDLNQSPIPKNPMYLPPLQPISHGPHSHNPTAFDWNTNGAPKVQQQLCHKMKMRQLELNAKSQQENHDQQLKMRQLIHQPALQPIPKSQGFNPSARENRHDKRMTKLGLPMDGTRGREESQRERKERRKRKKALKESAKRTSVNDDADNQLTRQDELFDDGQLSRCSTRNEQGLPFNLP
ncbi:unnamed protein product [Owenia fusiformis]|uniref:Uncharacterized protein n=1 Tax=Owenia fusiformis TaxID=6347 RepID=A0A8J1UMM2_OWEFU|nr:unnamed protein product [Owenia fusiformis]